MRKRIDGQILPMVMVTLMVVAIMITALVKWIQNDSQTTMKQQKTVAAINLAEAGIDRGTWMLQHDTSTWNQAAAGTVVPNYNFDSTFSDIPGGTYRIKFTSTTINTKPAVIITAEGRDNSTNEVRAIAASFTNQTIYSPLMAGGGVSWAKGLCIFWGPIMSQGDIVLQDNTVAAWYFPRKYAKGTVYTAAAVNSTYARDTNGLLPPNTDNTEWWSQYSGVPNVPILDFVALRSSASATGTLNIYGCKNSSNHGINNTIPGAAPWDLQSSCPSGSPHTTHFGDSTNYISTYLNAANNYVWYWDGDVTLTGSFCNVGGNLVPCTPGQSHSLKGSVVVLGSLTINSPGDLVYTGHVPTNAWQEEQKLTVNTNDTSASQEYPADIGFHSSTGTWRFGTDSWTQPFSVPGWRATVGIKGFTYIGGSLIIQNYLDFNGAVWVNGTVTASGGTPTSFCSIFYDDTLTVPALNVILLRQTWVETTPSTTAWP